MAVNIRSVDSNYEKHSKLCKIWDDTTSLARDFEELLNSTKGCDVLFIVGKNETHFRAHSLILITRCLKFQDQLCLESPIYKENWQPESFEKILKYIYTGKIELSTAKTLETLRIAVELKIPRLISKCEESFLTQLSIENCCDFYVDAMNMSEDSDGRTEDQLVKTCQSFIEENASEVIHTQGFLNLPKDALTQLISSDEFSLEEDGVWRAVLRWSKHQAKVEQAVEDWTDEERQRVCEHLANVIGNVRLLLVDSKVFAEEIEPTGAVPMELSLERYRYAAVPQRFSHEDDIRLRPRVCTKRFHGTTILWKNNSKYQSILNEWFGSAHQEWHLLYKATTDGFSSRTFHEKCDDFPKTFTIVQGTEGNICGGFSDVPWRYNNGNGKYSESSNCFLFSLFNTEGFPPRRFHVVRPKYSTLSHISLGPTFGAGADLSIADNCNVNTDSCSRISHSYNGEHSLAHKSLMGATNFKVVDYEVFVPQKNE